MEVKCCYSNKVYPLSFNVKDPSVSQLTSAIAQAVQVTQKNQKIILSGKVLSKIWKPKQKISKFGIKNGTKFLLVAPEQGDDAGQTKKQSRSRSNKSSRQKGGGDQIDQQPDQTIVEKGPPPGCLKGVKTPLNFFPDKAFIVYDASGVICKLSIEQESIWVQQDVPGGTQERTFLSDIQGCTLKSLAGFEDEYVMLYIVTTVKTLKFYFIPLQYSKCFIDYLQKTDK
ncbi:hypothetical protein TRFO_41980 [Tritrichomonas foetus]|uniref:Ubiquitin-like domain-containing protein n=1 Tax=Tritrichomonas foetus TaxID=1144522 RepID=A0A1J4KY67_9EUKA|nr:hypothetical protein TRFO_41980 [Tritrichomonas foetus]|eukprot:OHT16183.1 hypothetical protein TRFO_41980 [Tritrichomonas foetus]